MRLTPFPILSRQSLIMSGKQAHRSVPISWLQTLPKHPVIYPIRNNYQDRKRDEIMIKNSKLLTFITSRILHTTDTV